MRSYEMTEIVHRRLDQCLSEAFAISTGECEGVYLSVDIDVVDPGYASGTGTPEPGGLSSRQLLDAVRRICLELQVCGIDIVEVSPPYDHADITAALAIGSYWRRCPPSPANVKTSATEPRGILPGRC